MARVKPAPSSSAAAMASRRFFCVFSDVFGCEQVGVGLVVAAADTPTKLVQLCQSEFVGAVDDDGVGVGDVDAGFDDGGTEQHVKSLL